MSKRKAKAPVIQTKETTTDPFNELGAREGGRTVELEELVVHGMISESKCDDGVLRFEAEARVILHLEDGRVLNKVFDLDFDEDDLD